MFLGHLLKRIKALENNEYILTTLLISRPNSTVHPRHKNIKISICYSRGIFKKGTHFFSKLKF